MKLIRLAKSTWSSLLPYTEPREIQIRKQMTEASVALRRRMAEALFAEGFLSTPALRDAITKVELHRFVPELYRPQPDGSFEAVQYDSTRPQASDLKAIYSGQPFVVSLSDSGAPRRSLLSARLVAVMLESLDLEPGMTAVEIGTRTGYEAALMQTLVRASGTVYANCTAAKDSPLADDRLRRLGFRNVLLTKPGAVIAPPGCADRVLVTAGCYDTDPAWLELLSPLGIIVMPFNLGGWYLILKLSVDGNEIAGRVIGSAGNAIDPISGRRSTSDIAPKKTWSSDVQESQFQPVIEPNRLMDFWLYLGLICQSSQLIVVVDRFDIVLQGLGIDLGANEWAIVTLKSQRIVGTRRSIRFILTSYINWRSLGSPQKSDYHIRIARRPAKRGRKGWVIRRSWHDYIFAVH